MFLAFENTNTSCFPMVLQLGGAEGARSVAGTGQRAGAFVAVSKTASECAPKKKVLGISSVAGKYIVARAHNAEVGSRGRRP